MNSCVSNVSETITTHGDTNTMLLELGWAYRGDEAAICDLTSSGDFCFWYEKIVFVPDGIRVPTPCAKRPRSLANAVIHVAALSPVLRWRYSRALPDCASTTELACAMAAAA